MHIADKVQVSRHCSIGLLIYIHCEIVHVDVTRVHPAEVRQSSWLHRHPPSFIGYGLPAGHLKVIAQHLLPEVLLIEHEAYHTYAEEEANSAEEQDQQQDE